MDKQLSNQVDFPKGLFDASGRLALRPAEAAKALGIGERLLWSKTKSGEIPHARIGRTVVYSIDALREYLAQQSKGGRR
ncbi:MAG: helix-turn-helix domain-containing protein [Planctomycetota bacterium]